LKTKKELILKEDNFLELFGVPKGIRTPVAGVKELRYRPDISDFNELQHASDA